MTITISVNGAERTIEADPDMPLLWALRDLIGLTGTKFGCGAGLCGACAVHLDGQAARACQVPVGDLQGVAVTTVEGLGTPAALHPVQRAWVEGQVAQCGYCQSGQIMAAAALLAANPDPSEDEIVAAMDGHICRCATYPRIRAAVRAAANAMRGA